MRDRLNNLGKGLGSADAIEIPLRSQPLQDDGGIDSLATVVQVLEMLVQQTMCVVVEVFTSHNECHIVTHVRLQQHTAEHRPLSVGAHRLFTQKGKLGTVGRACIPIPPSPATAPIAVSGAASTS
jgi:hypothetical protein